jgi:hypothetical protein
MAKQYPLTFTLEDGVHVEVNQIADKTYDFVLRPEKGEERHFTFKDDKPRDEMMETLDFDQLNAVRRFWLEQEDIV